MARQIGMCKGEPAEGLEFYELLCADSEFCAELGRAVLAAGRLESSLIRHIRSHAPEAKTTKATLGRLLHVAEEHELLSKMVPVLRELKGQRDYLTHNVHALFSGLIEETILEGRDLLDSDVALFTERAWQLKENLNGLAEIVENDT